MIKSRSITYTLLKGAIFLHVGSTHFIANVAAAVSGYEIQGKVIRSVFSGGGDVEQKTTLDFTVCATEDAWLIRTVEVQPHRNSTVVKEF